MAKLSCIGLFMFILIVKANIKLYSAMQYACSKEFLEQNIKQYCLSSFDFNEIPKDINGLDVNFLWFCDSNLTELKKESFASLTKLNFLSLRNNTISYIEYGTFLQLRSLEILDLSRNALFIIPYEVFEHPNLQHLSIAEHDFGDNAFNDIPKPINAPLTRLNIAGNRLFKVPDFGILPHLKMLNISMNDLRAVVPQQFSQFCRIEEIFMEQTEMTECQNVEITLFFFRNRHQNISLAFSYINVIFKDNSCSLTELDESKEYHECVQTLKLCQWPISVIFGAVFLFSIVFVIHAIMKHIGICGTGEALETINLQNLEGYTLLK